MLNTGRQTLRQGGLAASSSEQAGHVMVLLWAAIEIAVVPVNSAVEADGASQSSYQVAGAKAYACDHNEKVAPTRLGLPVLQSEYACCAGGTEVQPLSLVGAAVPAAHTADPNFCRLMKTKNVGRLTWLLAE